MASPMVNQHDQRAQRCKRLGHTVTFEYCRTQEAATVCPHILNCWWETFDVADFLRQHLPADIFRQLTQKAPPKPKLQSIMELIEEARTRNAGEKKE